MRPAAFLITAASLALLAAPLTAQDPALVEALAPLLMAEDRRQLDLTAMSRAIGNPDGLVRRTAVVAVGRIGDRRGAPLLVEALGDRDPAVVADAFFAIGLLADSANVPAIIARLRQPDTIDEAAAGEAAAALARSGGSVAIAALAEIIGGRTSITAARRDLLLPVALLESWRLAAQAPVAAILPYLTNPDDDLRWRATYTLARLRAPVAGNQLLRAARDKMPLVREAAIRPLTRAYADSAGLPPATVLAEVRRALQDASPGVKINALQALGAWRDSAEVAGVVRMLTDADFNVRVQAATALGELRGAPAMIALDALFDRKDASWAMRRVALTALARSDTARFAKRAAAWQTSADVRERIASYEAWGSISGTSSTVFQAGLQDADARVHAVALSAWRSARARNDSTVLAAARERLRHPAPEVRATAAGILGANARAEDLDPLLAAWRLGNADVERDAQQAVLATLAGLARRVPDILQQLGDPSRRDFFTPPADLLLRRDAARSWPALSERWGPALPVVTGRSLEDYRGIVRTLVLAKENPHVTVELDGRGTIDLELLGREAPLTVANFLRLIDRHWFDGNRWHRVVPNFVVQDGDRSGTGSGGPGWTIRDEINRRRYDVPMAGMALSGPDTGGSQWFINVSPQPHLDGRYTIFGRVAGSYAALHRITQGDLIRSIHR
jgi:cyclophilin family peptidyl-prolyl cis-trans isomerase/HEAT repeat protein